MASSTIKVPNVSKEVEQWLNSNEESDDDCELFDAPVLQKRGSTKSSSPKRKHFKTNEEKLAQDNVRDKDQALEIAREIVAASLVVPNIPSISYLRWHVCKKSCLPCIILDNKKEQAECLNIQLSARRDTLVEYIGYKHSNRGKCAAVRQSQLEPIHEASDRSTCSASHIKRFLACIKSQKAFQQPQELLIEQHVVQCILEKVLVQWQSTEAVDERTKMISAATATIEHDSVSEDKCDDTSLTGEGRDLSVEQKATSINFWEPAHTVVHSEDGPIVISQTAAEVESQNLTTARRLLRPRQQRHFRQEHTIRRLRAGDVVEYHDPIKVADRSTLRVATITECLPRSSYIAIRLDDGQVLTRDDTIRVRKQLLRGKLKDVSCRSLVPISKFDLICTKLGNASAACSDVGSRQGTQPQLNNTATAIWKAGIEAANDIVRVAFARSDDEHDDNRTAVHDNNRSESLQKRSHRKCMNGEVKEDGRRKQRRQTLA